MKVASLTAILGALGTGRVDYLIAGGLAVAAHGYGRVTFDLDLVLRLETANLHAAGAALAALGYRPVPPVTWEQFAEAETRSAWIREKGMVVLQLHSDAHADTPIDIFAAEPFDFAVEHARALEADLGPGAKARFVALDTIITMKTSAGRPKDIDDARQLRMIQERLHDHT